MKTYGWRIRANEITEIGKTPTAARVVNKKRSRQDSVKALRKIMAEIADDLRKTKKKKTTNRRLKSAPTAPSNEPQHGPDCRCGSSVTRC